MEIGVGNAGVLSGLGGFFLLFFPNSFFSVLGSCRVYPVHDVPSSSGPRPGPGPRPGSVACQELPWWWTTVSLSKTLGFWCGPLFLIIPSSNPVVLRDSCGVLVVSFGTQDAFTPYWPYTHSTLYTTAFLAALSWHGTSAGDFNVDGVT